MEQENMSIQAEIMKSPPCLRHMVWMPSGPGAAPLDNLDIAATMFSLEMDTCGQREGVTSDWVVSWAGVGESISMTGSLGNSSLVTVAVQGSEGEEKTDEYWLVRMLAISSLDMERTPLG